MRHTGPHAAPRHLHPGRSLHERSSTAHTSFEHVVDLETNLVQATQFPDRNTWDDYFRSAHHAHVKPEESKQFYESIARMTDHPTTDHPKG